MRLRPTTLLLTAAALSALSTPVLARQETPPAPAEQRPETPPPPTAPAEPPPTVDDIPAAEPDDTPPDAEAEPPMGEDGEPADTLIPPSAADEDAGAAAPIIVTLPIPEVWSPSPRDDEGRTAYGLYLAGRNAITSGQGSEGAGYLAQVRRLTPEQPLVSEQAFTAALLAGDLDEAAELRPDPADAPAVIAEAGRLVEAVQTFARGDARTAHRLLSARPIGAPHARAGQLVSPWIAAAARDWRTALAPVPDGATDLASQVRRFQRAQLLEIRRRYPEAEAEYRVLTAGLSDQTPFRIGYGAFLERRRRWDEALALYASAPDVASADDVRLTTARTRAAAKGRPPALPTLRQGAASALTTAAAIASSQRAFEFSAVYVRLALNIAPSDDVRLLLGSSLAQARLEPAARDALAAITPDNPEAYAAARVQMAASYARADDEEAALEEFRRAYAAAPDNAGVAYYLAAQLVQLKREAEALPILNGPLLATETQAAETHFLRGAAYEALGRTAEAEAELQIAVARRPDDATFLNYLGYLWVDNGTRVEEGAALIARAMAADPADGNIRDSLGWAQYKQGRFAAAVDTLELAVASEPANAEINDHLGDAYWQVGRKREAGYQWSRVLTLDPDAERKASVERKLVEGLPAATDAPAAAAAAAPAASGER